MRFTNGQRRCCLLATVLTCAAAVGRADDGPTWLDVVADKPIDHGVMIRGPFADAHEKLALTGPMGFVSKDDDAGFAAYAATGAADREVRAVRVGAARAEVRLGPVEFLLVPARQLVEGAPARDAGRGVYEVRPILDVPDAITGLPAAAGRPTHLGLPADYRHHFDRVPVEDAARGLIFFTADASTGSPAPVRIADDFGLHRLERAGTSRAGAWIAVQTADR